LEKTHSAVINATTAQKYFGTTDAVGKQFETDGNDTTETFVITAVVADWPIIRIFFLICLFRPALSRFLADLTI
jgi:hypothetical protein